MKAVLIILLLGSYSSDGGPRAYHIEFKSMTHCELAIGVLRDNIASVRQGSVRIILSCVWK